MSDEYARHRFRNFTQVRRFLRDEREAAGFCLRFIPPSARAGAAAVHAVRDASALDLYARALSWAMKRLTAAPIGLLAPARPIIVYVFEIAEWRGSSSPVTLGDTELALPARSDFSTIEQECKYRVSAAVHEMTHAICANQPKMSFVSMADTPSWTWLAEATAVWVESRLDARASHEAGLPHSMEWLSFGIDWCDFPCAPVDHPLAKYQAFLFLHYLTSMFGEKFLGCLWREGNADQDSWLQVEQLTGKTRDELFADYAKHSYLMNDPTGSCYAPEIYARFGGRAVTRRSVVHPGDVLDCESSVHPLGCHYFSLCSDGASSIRFPLPANDAINIAAGLATQDMVAVHDARTEDGFLVVDFDGPQNHAWLAVCGKAGSGRTRFSIRAEAR